MFERVRHENLQTVLLTGHLEVYKSIIFAFYIAMKNCDPCQTYSLLGNVVLHHSRYGIAEGMSR